jgi:hypothetical protein
MTPVSDPTADAARSGETWLFNIPPNQYKRFLNFLRKHDCLLPYREFRVSAKPDLDPEPMSFGRDSGN